MSKNEETKARECLAECLKNPNFRETALNAILGEKFKSLNLSNVIPIIEEEEDIPLGRNEGRTDITIKYCEQKVCVILELKVKAAEHLSQYDGYKRAYTAMGNKTFVIAIIGKYRKNKLSWFIQNSVANVITWFDLYDKLHSENPKLQRLESLEKLIRSLHVKKSEPHTFQKPQPNDIKLLSQCPITLNDFFIDFHNAIDDGLISGRVEKSGNAPFTFAFGRQHWADWFHDSLSCKIHLMFEERRGKRTDIQKGNPFFTFGIMLFHRNERKVLVDNNWTHEPKAQREMIKSALLALPNDKYEKKQNLRSEWGDSGTLKNPYTAVNPRSNKWIVAHYEKSFKLYAEEYQDIGWDCAIKKLASEANKLVHTLDTITEFKDQ